MNELKKQYFLIIVNSDFDTKALILATIQEEDFAFVCQNSDVLILHHFSHL